MKRHLSLGLAVLWIGLWPASPAKASLSQENLRTFLQRVGAKVESSKGGLFVTTMASGHARVEIRLLNDAAKQRLGLYAYGFGNVGAAKDAGALYEYLLRANSELGIGGFFVDKDKDIGYKFLVDTRDPLSFETFSIVYLAMVNVIAERRPEIAKMLTGGPPAEKPADAPPEDTSAPGAAEAPSEPPPLLRLER
jgi:hypothetical protein